MTTMTSIKPIHGRVSQLFEPTDLAGYAIAVRFIEPGLFSDGYEQILVHLEKGGLRWFRLDSFMPDKEEQV